MLVLVGCALFAAGVHALMSRRGQRVGGRSWTPSCLRREQEIAESTEAQPLVSEAPPPYTSEIVIVKASEVNHDKMPPDR